MTAFMPPRPCLPPGPSSGRGSVARLAFRRPVVLVLLLATAMLGGCFTMPRTLPEAPPKAVRFALEPAPDNRLDGLSRELLADHPEDESGFLMLSNNADALRWRLLLADMAEVTLDMQYYVWKADASADLLLQRVIRAADRGVRIRLLVDDITLMGSDPAVAALSRHPQIEIRLFNPIEGRNRSPLLRGLEFMGKIEQLNHRMHNKLMVADNRLAIVGGRNIGNEYFGLNPKQNFVDFDVLAVGEIVPRIAFSFDLFWNSDGAYPGEGLIENHPDPGLLQELRNVLDEKVEDHREALAAFGDEALNAERMLATLEAELYTGSADVIYDRPLAGKDIPPVQLIESLRKLTRNAQKEILASTPYLVPDEENYMAIAELVGRGVQVAVLTNSLGATNHPIVHSGYKKHRRRVLETGVALFEFRRDAQPDESPDTPPVTAKYFGLHAKLIVIDRRIVFVGSLNLDPRSIYVNTEVGLLIDSPELAEAITIVFENLVAPENSWQVRNDGNNRLAWHAGAAVRKSEPPSSLMRRFQAWFFGLFSLDEHL
jgi:putative cardiolipin synthase